MQLIQILTSLCQQKSVLLFSNNICIISHKAEHGAALLQEPRRSSLSQCWGPQAQKMLLHAQCCNSKIYEKSDLPKQCQRLTPQQGSALPLPEGGDSWLSSVWCCTNWFWWERTPRRQVAPEYSKGGGTGGCCCYYCYCYYYLLKAGLFWFLELPSVRKVENKF